MALGGTKLLHRALKRHQRHSRALSGKGAQHTTRKPSDSGEGHVGTHVEPWRLDARGEPSAWGGVSAVGAESGSEEEEEAARDTRIMSSQSRPDVPRCTVDIPAFTILVSVGV